MIQLQARINRRVQFRDCKMIINLLGCDVTSIFRATRNLHTDRRDNLKPRKAVHGTVITTHILHTEILVQDKHTKFPAYAGRWNKLVIGTTYETTRRPKPSEKFKTKA